MTTLTREGVVVEVDLIAEQLGISTELFWQEIARGALYGVLDRGEGADSKCLRLTFRYRTRSWSVTFEDMVH